MYYAGDPNRLRVQGEPGEFIVVAMDTGAKEIRIEKFATSGHEVPPCPALPCPVIAL